MNLPAAADGEGPDAQSLGIAVRLHDPSIEPRLLHALRQRPHQIMSYESFDDLLSLVRRRQVDLIVITAKGGLANEIELLRRIQRNVFVSIIPTVVFHPEPSLAELTTAYECGADDVISGEWVDKLVEVRLQRVLERSRKNLAINPSTRLPGPSLIDREISAQLSSQSAFSVCYADLDNFKAYNDFYGYAAGDRLIGVSAKIIKDTVFDLCREGFVGHIAGDDFVFIIPDERVPEICTWIIKTFDTAIPNYYDAADVERGSIMSINRKGEQESFPLLSISIAVVSTRNRRFKHHGELSRTLAELKKAAKAMPGSNYLVDRRRASPKARE